MKITWFSSLILLLCAVSFAFISGCGSNPTGGGGSATSITLLSISGTVTVSPETNQQLEAFQTRSGCELAQLFSSPAYAANQLELEPLKNAVIKVYEYSNPTNEIAATTTDNDGKYNVKGLLLNQVYLIIAKKSKGTIEATIKNIAWGLTNDHNKTVDIDPRTSVVAAAIKGNDTANEMLENFGEGANIDTAVSNIVDYVNTYYDSHSLPSVTGTIEIVVPNDISNEVAAMEYTLNVSIEGTGTVTLVPQTTGNKYLKDTIVKIQANPGGGYVLASWEGDLTGNTNPTLVTMNGNKNVTTVFLLSPLTITSPANGQVFTGILPAHSLTWTAVTGATEYTLEISTYDAFPVSNTYTVTSDSNSWPPTNYNPNSSYTWYFKVKASKPAETAWSTSRYFIWNQLPPYLVPSLTGSISYDGIASEWGGIAYAASYDGSNYDLTYADGRSGTQINNVKLGQYAGELYIMIDLKNGTPDAYFCDYSNYSSVATGEPTNLTYQVNLFSGNYDGKYMTVNCRYDSGYGQWWRYAGKNGTAIDASNNVAKGFLNTPPSVIETSIPISEITSYLVPDADGGYDFYVQIYRWKNNIPENAYDIDSIDQFRIKF